MDQETLLITAIGELVEDRGCYTCYGDKYENVRWTIPVEERPNKQQVQSKIEELGQLEIDTQYQLDRVTGAENQPLKYAPDGEQFDQIYHAIDQELLGEKAKTSEFYLNNKAVKEAHQKPT